jgi:hypothetical protein
MIALRDNRGDCWRRKRAEMGDDVTILFGGEGHFADEPVKLDPCLRERLGEAAFLVVNQE